MLTFILPINPTISDGDIGSFRFVKNCPSGLYDGLGLWPSGPHPEAAWMGLQTPLPSTHQNSIRRAIPGLSQEDYQTLGEATIQVDMQQDPRWAFTHAQRAPNQSVEEARRAANDFVKNSLIQAKKYLCACPSNRKLALHYFGLGLHTVQDSTSPSHNGFTVWEGSSLFWPAYHAIQHVRGEAGDPGPGSNLDSATAWLWGFFECGKKLPDDFFSNFGMDSIPGQQPTFLQ